MKTEEISNKIKEIIISSLELKITSDKIIGKDLVSEFGINSIDALEIFVSIENAFDIQFEDEDLSAELLASINELTDYIKRKCMEQSE